MSLIIDLIIIGILVICILMGYKKGLTGSILKIVSFILALVIAFILFKPVSNIVIDHTNWDETLEQSIRQMAVENNEEGQDAEESSEKKGMPDVIMNYINEAVEKAGEEARDAIIDSTAREVAVTIINGGVLISLFIIARIILFLVKGLASLLTELPIIKQFDKLGGIIFGLLQSLVIIYILLAVISFISPMIAETGFIRAIQESNVGSILYNNNLLLKLFF